MSKKSKKEQGKSVTGASESAKNQMRFPQMLERGLGSSFAMAVNRVMDQVSSLSGSKNGFLGVEKVTLDPVEHGSHSLIEKKEK